MLIISGCDLHQNRCLNLKYVGYGNSERDLGVVMETVKKLNEWDVQRDEGVDSHIYCHKNV